VIAVLWPFGKRLAARLAIAAALGLTIPILTLSFVNGFSYGTFSIVDVQSTPFLNIYGSLARLQSDEPPSQIPITLKTFDRLARIAPTETERLVEAIDFPKWSRAGCETKKISPCDGEIRAGWLLWALRDALQKTGAFESPSLLQARANEISQEIQTFCNTNPCNPLRLSLAPQLTFPILKEALNTWSWFSIRPQTVGGTSSNGPEFFVRIMSEMTRTTPLPTAPREIFAREEFSDETISRYSALNLAPGDSIQIQKDSSNPSLSWTHRTCNTDTCVAPPHGPDTLFYDSQSKATRPLIERDRLVRKILKPVILGFYFLDRGLLILGLALLSAMILSRKGFQKSLQFPTILTLTCVALVTGRALLLAIIDVTSFPAFNILYFSPASALMRLIVVFALLSVWKARQQYRQEQII
jgi:hypothetical protein